MSESLNVSSRASQTMPRTRHKMKEDKPNDNDVQVELVFLAIDCVSYVDEAIGALCDRAGAVDDHNLPHFDGVVVL